MYLAVLYLHTTYLYFLFTQHVLTSLSTSHQIAFVAYNRNSILLYWSWFLILGQCYVVANDLAEIHIGELETKG